jgi:hypothetical protein
MLFSTFAQILSGVLLKGSAHRLELVGGFDTQNALNEIGA